MSHTHTQRQTQRETHFRLRYQLHGSIGQLWPCSSPNMQILWLMLSDSVSHKKVGNLVLLYYSCMFSPPLSLSLCPANWFVFFPLTEHKEGPEWRRAVPSYTQSSSGMDFRTWNSLPRDESQEPLPKSWEMAYTETGMVYFIEWVSFSFIESTIFLTAFCQVSHLYLWIIFKLTGVPPMFIFQTKKYFWFHIFYCYWTNWITGTPAPHIRYSWKSKQLFSSPLTLRKLCLCFSQCPLPVSAVTAEHLSCPHKRRETQQINSLFSKCHKQSAKWSPPRRPCFHEHVCLRESQRTTCTLSLIFQVFVLK